jgi:hypothetical protein
VHANDVKDVTSLPAYVADFCAARQIPSKLYLGVITVERRGHAVGTAA